jgi:hypothetical protein
MYPGVPVRQPYVGVDFIPQSGIYEFGYSTLTHGPTVLLGDAVCRHLGFAEGAIRVFHVEALAEPLPDHLKERIQARGPLIFLILKKNVLHCTENQIYVFPEVKLRGLVPNSYIHVSVSVLHAYLAATK